MVSANADLHVYTVLCLLRLRLGTESQYHTAERQTRLWMFEVYLHVSNSQYCQGRHPHWTCPSTSSFCIELTEKIRIQIIR